VHVWDLTRSSPPSAPAAWAKSIARAIRGSIEPWRSKVLPAQLAADPQFRERFEREARAISSLQHPNICALFDVGHQDPSTGVGKANHEKHETAFRVFRGRSTPTRRLVASSLETNPR